VRPLRKGDIRKLLNLEEQGLTDEGRDERNTRLQIARANVGKCYVATTEDGTPCYIQWIIGPEDNKKLPKLSYCMGSFPVLQPGEALLEGAFTPEGHRGKRIMPYAMSIIAEKGLDIGARRIITFVTQDNIASLKGCKRAGFSPYLVRSERWQFFRKRITFTALPAGTPYPFDR
jgi:RimJ/RimL family protein N-acetyltransferase